MADRDSIGRVVLRRARELLGADGEHWIGDGRLVRVRDGQPDRYCALGAIWATGRPADSRQAAADLLAAALGLPDGEDPADRIGYVNDNLGWPAISAGFEAALA